MRRAINGILLLDKPANFTSNQILQKVKHLFRAKKAGHTGSLDPIATGMLPICFGEATKFSQFLLESDKSYYVVAKLGEETTTGDSEGEVTRVNSIDNMTSEKIEHAVLSFHGKMMQIPPMYSAIKVEGKPLYKLARQGIEIAREAREIYVHEFSVVKIEAGYAAFRIRCSKGTYVRTLIEDLGRALGCGAHVVELRREFVAPYQHATMYTWNELQSLTETMPLSEWSGCLLPVESTVQVLPAVKLTPSATFYMRMGQAVRVSFPQAANLVRLFSDEECFLGVGEVLPDGRIKPHRMLANSEMQKVG